MPASYIPSGYRLLNENDNGKIFGVDLEPTIYIDNTAYVEPDIGAGSFYLYLGADFLGPLVSSCVFYEFFYSESSSGSVTIRFNCHHIEGNSPLTNKIYDGSNWINGTYVDITQPLTLYKTTGSISTSVSGVYDLINWLYVKDKVEEPEEEQDPYNIKLIEPKLTIHCEGATMEKDIVVTVDTVEEWDGSYTESDTDPSVSGYTVTLEGTFDYGGSYIKYKINGGDVVSTEGASSPIVLEGVETIVFSGGSGSYGFNVGTTPNGSEIGSFQVEEVTYNPTSNITLYISSYGGGAN